MIYDGWDGDSILWGIVSKRFPGYHGYKLKYSLPSVTGSD